MAHDNTSHVVHFIYIDNRLSQNMCLTNDHTAPKEFFCTEHHIAQCTNQETHSILELFQMRQNHLLSLQHVEHSELQKHHSPWSLVALEQDQSEGVKPVGLKDCHAHKPDSQMPLHMLDICQNLLVFDSHCSPENQVVLLLSLQVSSKVPMKWKSCRKGLVSRVRLLFPCYEVPLKVPFKVVNKVVVSSILQDTTTTLLTNGYS